MQDEPAEWFHVEFSTYGTWLPGDPRGFRSWKHHIHSSGNYKDPPPEGEHAGLLASAVQKLKKPPVYLSPEQRRRVLDLLVAKAAEADALVLAIAVSVNHTHVLLKVLPQALSRELGRLKRASSHGMRAEIPGSMWGSRFGSTRVATREHQLSALRYILRHREEGAAVWCAVRRFEGPET